MSVSISFFLFTQCFGSPNANLVPLMGRLPNQPMFITLLLSFDHGVTRKLVFINSFMTESLSYSNHLQSKSMNWFLYDSNLRHERVNLLGNSYIYKHLLILKLLKTPKNRYCRKIISKQFSMLFNLPTIRSNRK